MALGEYTTCPGLAGTHLDPSLGVDARIEYMLSKLTLAEKVAQLQNNAPALPALGIPSYNYLNDDQHGVGRTSAKATVFPNGCGLGATWDKRVIHAAGRVLGLEARGLHNYFLNQNNRGGGCNGCGLTIYGPNLNLVRDPRWGRGQEVMGEDPFLMARLVVEWVLGAQNNSAGDSVGPNGKHVLSGLCCKHFAAYDLEDKPAARQVFNANLTSRSMWETYMPAFEACIKEAKATHVMCSYNSVQGVPTCGSHGLLTEILRDQWGFDGFVVSDYDAWANIRNTHHYAPDMEGAAAVGINAGLDQEGGGNGAISKLPQAIQDGKVTEATLDTAFKRNFRIRIRLGMLDPPNSVPYNALNGSEALSDPHRQIALQAALKSMTLLKNERAALPLKPADFGAEPRAGRLAIVGPQAKMAGLLMGNYAESASNGQWGTSIFDAIVALVGNGSVTYAQGCPDVSCGSTAGFAEAAAAAKTASAVVVTLGLDFNGGAADESEGHDRSAIELVGNQAALVAAIVAGAPEGTPVIGVLVHGGTIALGAAGDSMDAILSAWYPGIEGGHAVAATLFGNYNPAGRSASTWYRNTSYLPPPGEMDELETKMTYRYIEDTKSAVLYPFGHGLSYSTFAYTNLAAGSATVAPCGSITVTVTVANTGGPAAGGEEVVQVYAKLPDATVPTTRIRLVAFERVHIAAHASATVTLTVQTTDLAVVYANADVYQDSRQIEKGRVQLFVGGGQPDYTTTLTTTVKVADAKKLAAC